MSGGGPGTAADAGPRTRRPRRHHHHVPLPGRRSAGSHQARPHTGERGRSRSGAGRARPFGRGDRPLGGRRGVRRHARLGGRVPLDHRPDRRHQELRPRRADLGHAASASNTRASSSLGVVSAPALQTRWWAARGMGAFRNGDSIRVSSVVGSGGRADLVCVGLGVQLRRERHGQSDARTFAAVLAHARPRRLLAAPARCRRRLRHRDRSDRVAVGRRRARPDRRRGGRTLEHDRRPRGRRRRQLRVHERPPARRCARRRCAGPSGPARRAESGQA